MTTLVRLLGPPHAVRRGVPLPRPRGRKSWALLALVLTSSGPVPRSRAQEMLFPDAEDPQAALRWALTQVRRATGGALEIGGDPLCCTPAGDATVDVIDVIAGRRPTQWPAAEAVLPLLEGAEPDVAEFGTWLLGRRRSLRDAGVRIARAGSARAASPTRPSLVREMVELGGRMFDAGASRDGARILADAAHRARGTGDDDVLAQALARFGSGVVHAIASSHDGAAGALREAAGTASRGRHRETAAMALRELGFVASANGDLAGALRMLDTAQDAADGLPDQLSGVHYVRGFALTDAGRTDAALRELDRAAECGDRAGRPRRVASALAMRARARLQRGEEDLAAEDVAVARAMVHELGWTAMHPWVDSLAAEIAIRAGRLDEAETVLQDARALAEVLRDDCWLILTARGLASVRAKRGRPDEAVSALSDACTAMASSADPCCWIELSVRDALCSAAQEADPAAVPRHAAELAALADRTGLVEFATRAALHRARAGDRDAMAEARARAATQGNPALDALVARA
jgi:tetratricopeptide (TPR) repeat protein